MILPPRIMEVLKIIEDLRINNCEKYLDVGCGDGEITRVIAQRLQAKYTYGIDKNVKRLQKAAKKGIKVFKLDLNREKFPFPNNYIDVITSLEVIEHLENPDNMLKEIHRVLKPSGFFILSTPNLASWTNRVWLLLGAQPTYCEVSTEIAIPSLLEHSPKLRRPMGHIRLFTLHALKYVLMYHGFNVVKVVGSSSTRNIHKLVYCLDVLIGKINPSLARIIIILAKK